MNKRIKRLWVRALRSGKYKQGDSKLRQKRDGQILHCCLGVLEEIHVMETGKRFSGGRGGFSNLLSKSACEWAGLDDPDPVLAPKATTTAAEMNDDGKTFKFIADRIEKYL